MPQAKKFNLKKAALLPEPLNAAGEEREACQLCGLYRHCKAPYARPHIPEGWTGKLLIVGDVPGEDSSGKPFVGEAGKLLKLLWRRAGYRDVDVAVVDSIRCRPRKNAAPSMTQVRACRPFLLRVIKTLKPQFVLGCGATAMRALRNDGEVNITRNRGKEIAIAGLCDVPSGNDPGGRVSE